MGLVTTISTHYYAENNTRYVFLDGSSCKRLDACFNSLQQQLSIPAYFGNNLDALEEVINDLDWIKEDQVKIIIYHAVDLLEQEPDKKIAFLEILHTAGPKKMEIIYLGDSSAHQYLTDL
ncbi:MAG: barstar family protein [Bacteroidota bacterium]